MASEGRIRILVADDDSAFVETVRAIFQFDERLEIVGQASDGAEAVRLAEELSPDVVAMDVVMPVIDGIEATRLIRASQPECRVVLVSGSIFQERRESGIEVARAAGACDYVLKSRAVLELPGAVVSAVGASADSRR